MKSRFTLCAAGLLSLAAFAPAQIVSQPFPQPVIAIPRTPPKYRPGTPTIIAAPGVVTVVATGQTFTTSPCGGGPINNAVAYAVRIAGPGDVIGVTGAHPVVEFVANFNPCKPNEASWANGAVIRDLDIVALDATASLQGVFFKGDYTQPGQGGIDRVTLQGLRFLNQSFSFSPIQSNNTSRHGLIRIYDCSIDALDPTAWAGKGMKFGMRLYLMSYDIRNNVFVTGAQEHNIYVDSPGYDGAYPTSMIVVGNVTNAPTGRTGLQLVNRVNPTAGYVGATGKGTVIIRNNQFHADASAGGGSTITIAGHHGKVWIHNNHVTSSGGAGGSVDTGGFVAWDGGNNPSWLLPSGHANKNIYVIGNTFVGTGSRANIKAESCQFVYVGNNTLQGAGHGVDFDDTNGSEFLPASTMAGWQQGGCKARDVIMGSLVCLTDNQIDTLY